MTAIINFNSISGVSTISANTKINVGSAFLQNNAVGLGTTDTTGRNAGVGTDVGTLIYNAADSVVQVYNGTRWDQLSNVVFNATGGTTFESGGSKYHIFTTGPASLVVTSGTADAEILVVGGGGGGGRQHGGGGGGGSVVHATSAPLIAATYPVTIGASGAAGGPPGPYSDTPANVSGGDGGTSTFGSSPLPVNIIANGGGGGSGYGPFGSVGRPGGSGGGGSAAPPGGTGGTGTAPPTSPAAAATSAAGGKSYQNPAPNGPGSGSGAGSGGGGAGGAGSACSPFQFGGDGGVGQPFPAFPGPIFTPMPSPWQSAVGPTGLFGGGGGGGGHTNTQSPYNGGAAGPGGGGQGGNYFTPPEASSGDGDPGVDNTGGGGGAGGSNDVGASAGGTGVVIVRYPV